MTPRKLAGGFLLAAADDRPVAADSADHALATGGNLSKYIAAS
jgi:hypothetical protein